jgi:spore coat protein H
MRTVEGTALSVDHPLCLLLLPLLLSAAAGATPGGVLADPLPTYELEIEPAYWQWLLDNPTTETRVPGRFRFSGDDPWLEAGVRFRGAHRHRQQAEKSFNIRLPDGAPHRVVKLNHGRDGRALFWELVSYDFFRRVGYPAPAASPVRLLVNGAFLGVFTDLQAIDGDFLREHFGPSYDHGNLYKCYGNLTYEGEGDESYRREYEKKTNEAAADYSDVEGLSELLDAAPAHRFVHEVLEIVDLDAFLRWLSVQVVLSATDNWCCGNYYLYRHPASSRFHWLPWDYNGGILRNHDSSVLGAMWVPGPPGQPIGSEPYRGPASRLISAPGAWPRFAALFTEAALLPFIDDIFVRAADDVRQHNVDHGREPGCGIDEVPGRLREFIHNRSASLRRQLERVGPPEMQILSGSAYTRESARVRVRVADESLERVIALLDDRELRLAGKPDPGPLPHLLSSGHGHAGIFELRLMPPPKSPLRFRIRAVDTQGLATLAPPLSEPPIIIAHESLGTAADQLMISEVLFDGPGCDFVELTTIGTDPVSLHGVELWTGSQLLHCFDSEWLDPRRFILIAARPSLLISAAVRAQVVDGGELPDQGGELLLLGVLGEVLDRADYGPLAAAGQGPRGRSLVREELIPGSSRWTWSLFPGGTPGGGRRMVGVAEIVPSMNPWEAAGGPLELAAGIPLAGQATVAVHDARGRLVRRLAEGPVASGPLYLIWDGRNERGLPVSAGVYFIRLQTTGQASTRRVVLLR